MVVFKIVLAIHILSAVIWLSFLPVDYLLRNNIRKLRGTESEKQLLSIWLNISNILGISGLSGILITGIILVFISVSYSFFNFSVYHWLAAKQVILTIIIIITFFILIPSAKKLKNSIDSHLSEKKDLDDNDYASIQKVGKILSTINILVLFNFLLALSK